MKHYLLSIMLDDQWTMHGYVMAKRKSKVLDVCGLMLEKAEEAGFHVTVPVMLETQLDGAIEFVRNIAMENPEAKRLMAEATDLHYTVWLMLKHDPVSEKLMELH